MTRRVPLDSAVWWIALGIAAGAIVGQLVAGQWMIAFGTALIASIGIVMRRISVGSWL